MFNKIEGKKSVHDMRVVFPKVCTLKLTKAAENYQQINIAFNFNLILLHHHHRRHHHDFESSIIIAIDKVACQ